ncbi:MAG: ABC transporter permease [Planctomycetes bacterium]|nr:ABC transporter permease [Planctomycetota bacterium]
MILATCIKDLQIFARDRGGLAATFLLPLAFVTVFGLLFKGSGDGETPRERPMALWHEADDTRAEDLVARLTKMGGYTPRLLSSADAVREEVARERVRFGLIVPRDYDPFAGRPLQVVVDESAGPMVTGPLLGQLNGLLQSLWFLPKVVEDAQANGAPKPTFLVTEAPAGKAKPMQGIDSFQVAVPGNAVLFIFFLSGQVALTFLEERRNGTWKRLLASPHGRHRMLLGKLLPFLLIGLVQMTFLFCVGHFAFGMRIGGSALALAVVTCSVVLAAVGLGFLIASFGGSEKQIGGYSTIAVLVMALIGGCMVPRLMMPAAMKQFGLFTPHAWALEGYYDVLIRQGTTLFDVWTPVLVLCGFAAAFTLLGGLLFRFERT